MRMPWSWALLLLLGVCPAATGIVGAVYDRDHPVHSEPPFNEPLPLAYRVVVWLTAAHLGACATASVVVFRLTRGHRRYLALLATIAWLALTLALSFGAMMATTGVYL